MSIFDGIFGGQSGVAAQQAMSNANMGTNTGIAQQSYNQALNQQSLYNIAHQNNPQLWGQSAATSYGETLADLGDAIAELRYIMERTIENYGEIQTQYKALRDITKAGDKE
jgi:oligoribonuclease (3'-5' exoribonuclease)